MHGTLHISTDFYIREPRRALCFLFFVFGSPSRAIAELNRNNNKMKGMSYVKSVDCAKNHFYRNFQYSTHINPTVQ